MKLPVWFLNFDFGGRARRSHYWANLGAWLAVGVVFAIVASILTSSMPAEKAGGITGPLLGILLIGAAADNIAMVFRRAHDTNRSGWVWLLLLIPLINLLPLYWLMIQDSDQGTNKYGPPVKQFYDPAKAG